MFSVIQVYIFKLIDRKFFCQRVQFSTMITPYCDVVQSVRNDCVRTQRYCIPLVTPIDWWTKEMAKRGFACMKVNCHCYTHAGPRDNTTIKSSRILSFVHLRFEPTSLWTMHFNIFRSPSPRAVCQFRRVARAFYTRYCADPFDIDRPLPDWKISE